MLNGLWRFAFFVTLALRRQTQAVPDNNAIKRLSSERRVDQYMGAEYAYDYLFPKEWPHLSA